ncbi:MAG: hypothetical protein JW929_03600 [Anaerolineales bacterium]|nr:hypothetical protein [Anaerolineales bacterium]
MQQTIVNPPVTPPPGSEPAKKSPVALIISIIAAVILSMCCCCPGVSLLTGQGTWETYGMMGDQSGTIEPMYGLICIGAAIIPLFIPVIVFLVQRSKK